MHWHRLKLVLRRVNPLSARKTPPSTSETAYGADGPRKCAMLQTVRMPFAQRGDYCQKESVEKL